MQTSFSCPKCSNVLQADSSWAGQQTQCPYCKNIVVIPGNNSSTEQTPPQFNQPVFISPVGNPAFQVSPTVANNDFLYVRLFTIMFNVLRSMNFFQTFGKAQNVLIKTGAICYPILGLILFIIACIKSADASSAWSEIFNGLCYFLGLTVFAACGMYIFKLYDKLMEKEKPYTLPSSLLIVMTIISACACLYSIVYGITETCIADNGLTTLYEKLRSLIIYFPLFVVSLVPNLISITVDDDASPSDNAIGFCYFAARTCLFIVPFWWCYDALYRIVHIFIHLGAGKSKFFEAYSFSSKGLPLEILCVPILCYLAYLLFELIMAIIKKLLNTQEAN